MKTLVLNYLKNQLKQVNVFEVLVFQYVCVVILVVIFMVLLIKDHFFGPECTVCRRRIENFNV